MKKINIEKTNNDFYLFLISILPKNLFNIKEQPEIYKINIESINISVPSMILKKNNFFNKFIKKMDLSASPMDINRSDLSPTDVSSEFNSISESNIRLSNTRELNFNDLSGGGKK